MSKSEFEIEKIPETPYALAEVAENALETILSNYLDLIDGSIYMSEHMVDKDIIKPLVIYNMCFLVELTLKYYLIKENGLSIDEIEGCGHDISKLINEIRRAGYELDINKLDFLLKKFKDKQNCNLNFKNYYNFKYNRARGEEKLIFDMKCTDEEKKNIKVVIEWIKRVI